jgi:hypothetical protein
MTPVDPRLEALERSVRRNARWTTGLMVLFIALAVATVVYAYVEAQKVLNPARLVDEGEDFIKAHYPEWRADVKKELVKAAPAMAHRMAKDTEESMPPTRARIERYLDREAKAGVGKVQVIADQQFRKFVEENRADVRRGFAELRKAPAEVPKFADDLEQRLDKQLGVNLRQEAGVLLEGLDQLNAKLDRLAHGQDLTKSEQLERRIARTLRALQRKGAAAKKPARGGGT